MSILHNFGICKQKALWNYTKSIGPGIKRSWYHQAHDLASHAIFKFAVVPNLKQIITVECTKAVIFQLLRPLDIERERELIH